MRNVTSVPKLPHVRSPSQKPTGLRFVPKGEQIVGGPGDTPWPGFITGQNSLTEQNAYWALGTIFQNPPRDRLKLPPFYGGWPDWGYQVPTLGSHTRAVGSAVVDFMVYQGGTQIAIRIQTEFFHGFTTSVKHVYDVIQQAQIEAAGYDVVDIWDNDLLHDPSGQKYIITMKKAIGRLSKIDPIISGTLIRGSRQKVLGM